MRFLFSLSMMFGLCAGIHAQTCANNLLQNPGFESGLTNWSGTGVISTDAHAGTKAITVCQTDGNVRQTFAATPGTTYTLQLWAKNGGTAMQTLGRIKFMNSSWQPIDNEYIYVSSTAWTAYTASKAAPAGTAWVEVSIQKSGSGSGCAFADDLCFTAGGGSGPKPDLMMANINLQNPTVQPGDVLSYRFDLSNNGPAPVVGNFTIKAWLSTDDVLSANDIQDGVITTGNLGAWQTIPQVLGGTTVPATVTPGSYFLILKVDADGLVSESDETNNVLVSSSPLQVVASGGGAPACEVAGGTGVLRCVEPVPGSANFRVVMDASNNRTRKTYNAAGQVIQTENLGAVAASKVEIISNNSIRKTNADGSVAYNKPFPVALQNLAGTFTQVVENGTTGFVFLAWKPAGQNPVYYMDTLLSIKTDVNLQVQLKKNIATGSGFPGDNGAFNLLATNPGRFAFFQRTGTSTFQVMKLYVIDDQLNIKSTKNIVNGAFSSNAFLETNVCRGFTVTDFIGFGYCKSGTCYQSDRIDGEFVADTLQPYNTYTVSEVSTVGNGTYFQRWFAKTSDGGSLLASRVLTGALYLMVNDTITFKRYTAAGDLVWQKKVRVPGAGLINRIYEQSGQVYLFNQTYGGDLTVSRLDCYENAINVCAGNLLQNGDIQAATQGWQGAFTIIGPPYSISGDKSLALCQIPNNVKQAVPAQQGKKYTLSYKLKTEQLADVYVQLRFLTSGGVVLNAVSQQVSSPSNVTNFTLEGIPLNPTSPPYLAAVEVSFEKFNQGGACVYIDDVCLKETGLCTPDVTPPYFTGSGCPSDITLSTSGTSATHSWTPPTAADACGGTVQVIASATPGASFPLGTTTVTYTAVDAANNTANCSFKITVVSTGGNACSVNLLTNPGFESNLNNWQGTGETISPDAATGTKAVALCQNTSLRQTKAAVAGKTYTLLFNGKAATSGSKVLSYIKYLSASWQPLVTEYFDFTGTPSYTAGTVSKLAPAGTTWVEIGFLKQNSGCMLIDDVCLSDGGGGQPKPDLVLSNMAISNPEVAMNTLLAYNITMENSGNAPADGTFNLNAYISQDNVLSADDHLGGIVPTGYLAANSTAGIVNAEVLIPVSQPGNYWLIVKIDGDNLIDESNEGNNVLVSTNSISIVNSSSCVVYGNASNIFCFDNGTQNTSTDDQFSTLLTVNKTGAGTGSNWVGTVNGQPVNGVYSVALDLGLFNISGGPLHINFHDAADPSCQNSITVQPSGTCSNGGTYDFVSEIFQFNGSITNNTVNPNTPYQIFHTFSTISSATTGEDYVDKIYLSTDNQLSANDVLLTTFESRVFMPTGNTAWATDFYTIVIPANTADGNYYLIGKLDANNNIPETNENNNVFAQAITVQSSGGQANCTASSNYPWEDWIGAVKVGATSKTSGKSTYSNFSATVFTLTKATPTAITLTTAYSYFTWDEYWRIWIDYNHDNIFQTSEKAFEGILTKPANGTATKTLTGNIAVPASALTGNAKMRVVMGRSAYGEACGIIPFGEVEDYTVNIVQSFSSGADRLAVALPESADFTLFPNPATGSVSINLSAWVGKPARLTIANQLGQSVLEKTWDAVQNDVETIALGDLVSGPYFVKLESSNLRPVLRKFIINN